MQRYCLTANLFGISFLSGYVGANHLVTNMELWFLVLSFGSGIGGAIAFVAALNG